MTTPPSEPRDESTPADRAAGAMDEDQYLGRDSTADLEGNGRADGAADGGPGSGAGADDPTTEGDEDSRFA